MVIRLASSIDFFRPVAADAKRPTSRAEPSSSNLGRIHRAHAMAFFAEILFCENSVSTNSAEQPAPRDNAEGSVEQSAHPAPIKTLVDLRHWVEHLPEADRRTIPVCRVRDALRVLELDPSRDARKYLQALLKSWDIKQKEPSGKKRIASDVHHRLVTAVLVEGNRLRTMGRSVGSFSIRATSGKMFRNSSEQRDADISRRVRSRSPQL